MSAEREFERISRAWLRADGEASADRVLDRVLDLLDTSPQRRTVRPALRSAGMDAYGRTPRDDLARLALVVAAAVAVAIVGINLLTASERDEATESPAVASSPSPAATDLGVFEPARGRIVIWDHGHLEAIDPLDPTSVRVFKPGYIGFGSNVMPAGWSADGSKLALTTEHGDLFVMDQTGALDWVPIEQLPDVGLWNFDEIRTHLDCRRPRPRPFGCASSAWLSPDGTKGLVFESPGQRSLGPGRLYVMDLDDVRASRVIEVEGIEPTRSVSKGGDDSQPAMPVWSPDGTRIAYIWSKEGNLDTPAVGIVDLETGAARELISGWGLITQLAWSPDGSQLLVVAGPGPPLAPGGDLPASLFLVDVDDAEAHEVASGRFAAAAWSPDGSRIAAVDQPGTWEVIVIDADGSGARQVVATLDEVGPAGVVWHPIPAP
jgi:Tol biopolymer transport system component